MTLLDYTELRTIRTDRPEPLYVAVQKGNAVSFLGTFPTRYSRLDVM